MDLPSAKKSYYDVAYMPLCVNDEAQGADGLGMKICNRLSFRQARAFNLRLDGFVYAMNASSCTSLVQRFKQEATLLAAVFCQKRRRAARAQ